MDEHGVGYSKYGLVARMRMSNSEFELGDVRVKLANAYGFCWGVERAVQMAYEARRAYPGKQIHVINEIIHNPSVNGVCCPSHSYDSAALSHGIHPPCSFAFRGPMLAGQGYLLNSPQFPLTAHSVHGHSLYSPMFLPILYHAHLHCLSLFLLWGEYWPPPISSAPV